jgi:uroporphyrinogen decarboxylase
MEKAMMLLVTEPEMVAAAIEEIMKFFISYYERIFEAGSGLIDFLFYKDDFGAQNNLLISQTTFREFFFSNIKGLSDLAGSFGATFILHSCGSVMKLIPDFIEAGVAVLDPIQVTAREMDIYKLKQEFGQRLSFHGGIDVQRLMPFGTIEEITNKAKETIEVLGRDGGYFFSPSHRFQPDTPIENIAALYGAALKYGACV